ncbi:Cytidine and deoxycytidylate deaminase zinc-binding region [compost metagenome]
MYVTDMPCSECSKAIINAGIKKLYYCSEYPGTEARIMLGSVGIEIVQLDKPKILNHLQAFIKAIGN